MDDYIDIYCERLGPGILAEPLNALTNIAFFIAAYFACTLAQRRDILGPGLGLIIAVLIAIGVGSTLFHTLAVGWTQLADVLPILIFQVIFVILYARQVMRLGWSQTLILLLAFGVCVRFFESLPREILNGSLAYAPALIFLGGFGVFHWLKQKREPYVLLAASTLFLVSLSLRSLDMALCEAVPMGVHFFWHILNALVLYLALRGLMVNLRHKV